MAGTPCVKARGYTQQDLIHGTEIAGSSVIHERLRPGQPRSASELPLRTERLRSAVPPAFPRRSAVLKRSTATGRAGGAGLAAAPGALPAAGPEVPGWTVQAPIDGGSPWSGILSCVRCASFPRRRSQPRHPRRRMTVPPDHPAGSSRARRSIVEHQGRQSILLDGGAATAEGLRDARRRHRRGRRHARQRVGSSASSSASPTTARTPSGSTCASTSPVCPTRCSTRRSSTPASTGSSTAGPGFTGPVDIPQGRLVPPAARGDGRAGEALRQRHGRSRCS